MPRRPFEPPPLTHVEVLAAISSIPEVVDELAAADPPSGRWARAYLVFAASAHDSIAAWCAHMTPAVWAAFGFDGAPSVRTCQRNFRTLEAAEPRFRAAVSVVIAHSRAHDPEIGERIHVDDTPVPSEAPLVHDCPDSDPSEGDEPPTGDGVRVKIADHWYRTSDQHSGIRSFDGARVWQGRYYLRAVDDVTGAPVAAAQSPANASEKDRLADLLTAVEATTGTAPTVLVGDRAFDSHAFHRAAAQRGATLVTPSTRTNHPDGEDLARRHWVVEGDRHVAGSQRRNGPRRMTADAWRLRVAAEALIAWLNVCARRGWIDLRDAA